MKLLLTNDDGIDCDGLLSLERALSRDHEVWVMAPDSERSGTSHAMTLMSHTKVRRHGERKFSCSGMPADCVILAVSGLIPVRPDMVVSGINRGANLGTDLIYSGTAAAARQAAMMGIPSLAVSLAVDAPPFDFAPAATYVSDRIEELRGLWDEGIFLNLNLPGGSLEPEAPLMSKPCKRTYTDKVRRFEAPDGTLYCFLGEGEILCEAGEGTDAWAVSAGRAALSRIEVLPMHKERP